MTLLQVLRYIFEVPEKPKKPRRHFWEIDPYGHPTTTKYPYMGVPWHKVDYSSNYPNQKQDE